MDILLYLYNNLSVSWTDLGWLWALKFSTYCGCSISAIMIHGKKMYYNILLQQQKHFSLHSGSATLWHWGKKDLFLNTQLSKKNQAPKCRNASLFYLRAGNLLCSSAHLSVKHLWAGDVELGEVLCYSRLTNWKNNRTKLVLLVYQARSNMFPGLQFILYRYS